LHANSPLDALARLASLVVRAAPGWPLADVHAQVGRSIDVVVQVARTANGLRQVTDVVEVDPDGRRVHLLADAVDRHRPLVRRRS
jgi:pilus assembly protein CpaF